MEYRAAEVKAGVFIVISIAVLLAFLIAVTGVDFGSDKVYYRVRFKYVGGIEVGSMVRLGGMAIGKVVDINFPEDGDSRIELMLEVKEDYPIRRDSKAILTTIGIMGSNYVEISTGSSDSEVLPPGTLIPSEDVTAFAQMTGPISEISEKLSELLTSVNDLFNPENRENLSATLANLNRMMEQSSDNMYEVMANLNNISIQLKETLSQIHTLVVRSDTVLYENMTALNEVLNSTKGLLTNLNRTMQDVDKALLANSNDYFEIIKNLNTLTQNIEEFSQAIKEQPWSLVRKNIPPERRLP